MSYPYQGITPDDYQRQAKRTASKSKGPLETCILAMGLSGEAGEVTDYLKKVVGHGHEFDKDKLQKELGDVLWYLAVLADRFGLPLSEVMEANIEKLQKRYPEGFSSERSVNRRGDE